MKKRWLALLLAVVMTIGLLAGCGEKTDPTDATEANKPTQGQTQAPSTEKQDEKPEMTTVKILCTNDITETIKIADWETHEISQVFIKELEEIGIRLEVEPVDQTSLPNVIATRLAAGVELPDLMVFPYNADETVLGYANDGLVAPLNELLEQYDEDGSIKAYYDSFGTTLWAGETAPDGNLYWFSYILGPRTYTDPESGLSYIPEAPHTLSVRSDWAKVIGEELKEVYTPDELYDLLLKMYTEDANENGKNDEVVSVEIASFNNGFALAFGLTRSLLCGYFVGEEEVFSNFYHENFPAYIEFMQKLYKSGLYDTAALSDTDALRLENRASAVFGYGTWDFEANIREIDTDAQYTPVFVELDGDLKDGFHIWNDSPGPTANYNFFVPAGAENKEGVIRLMDYIYSDEYALLDRYGVQGVSWEYDEYGYPKSIPTESTAPQTLWATGAGLKMVPAIVKWGGVENRHDPAQPEWMYDKEEWRYQYYVGDKQYAIVDLGHQLALPTEEETAVIEEYATVLETYASELLTDLILGEKSLDDLAKYQKEMEELGLKEYMEVIQARRNRMVGAE